MSIFLLPLTILAMAEIFYFIVSGKSSPPVRKAAFAALVLVILSILVCSIFILSHPLPAVTTGPNYSPERETPPVPVTPLNIALVIGMSLIFLFFMILIVVAVRREQRRRKNG
jgi:heme A synthase